MRHLAPALRASKGYERRLIIWKFLATSLPPASHFRAIPGVTSPIWQHLAQPWQAEAPETAPGGSEAVRRRPEGRQKLLDDQTTVL